MVKLDGSSIVPITFDAWAYPPEFPPRQANFPIEPSDGRSLDVILSGELISDRDAEAENYGVYIYCNHRLIIKRVKVRDVGYL